jgi:hypothetical protein
MLKYDPPDDRSRRMARFALGIVSGVLLLAPFAWILRDGLGPGSDASSGLAAIAKSLWTFYWGPIAAALTALALILRRVTRTTLV